jgi:hypothetical protein
VERDSTVEVRVMPPAEGWGPLLQVVEKAKQKAEGSDSSPWVEVTVTRQVAGSDYQEEKGPAVQVEGTGLPVEAGSAWRREGSGCLGEETATWQAMGEW